MPTWKNQMMKEQQGSIQDIAGEVSNIKAQMNKGPVTDKGYIAGEQSQPSATAGKRWFDNGRDVQQHLQTRKLAYYNQLKSGGIASIYKSFLEQQPSFSPSKFREGKIPGKTEARRDSRNKIEVMKVTMEIEGLEEECSKHQSKIEETEREVEEIIGKYDDPEYRQELKEHWITKVKMEEDISGKIWKKKEKNFRELLNKEEVQENRKR